MADRELDLTSSATGGESSTWGERVSTSFEASRLSAGNIEMRSRAFDLYRQEIDRVKAISGVTLPNPMLPGPVDPYARRLGTTIDSFEAERARVLAQSPTAAPDGAAPLDHTLLPLYEQRMAAEKAAASALDRSPQAINTWILGKLDPAAFVGGFGGFASDPINAGSMLIGGGGARTGAAGVMWAATKMAAINAATTAVQQPEIQDWNRRAGMEHGLVPALDEIRNAALFGFVADGAVRGGARVVRKLQGRVPLLDESGHVSGYDRPTAAPNGYTPVLGPDGKVTAFKTAAAGDATAAAAGGSARPPAEASAQPAWMAELQRALSHGDRDAAFDIAAQNAPEGSMLRRAADGDHGALVELAHATGAIEDPAVRGAAAELERYKMFGPKPDAPAFEHYEKLADSIRRSMDPSEPPVAPPAAIANGLPGDRTFKTAKGSEYIVHSDGTTTRNKALRFEPGHEGDQGIKVRSQTTFYVSDAGAVALGEIQAQGHKRAISVLADRKKAAVRYLDGPSAGKMERRTLVDIEHEPRVGLTPVELWNDGANVHFGNKIVEVTSASHKLSPEAMAARERLVAQEGTPVDLARVMREQPDLVTQDLHLSDHKMRQATLLSRLSDDAFERVAGGQVAANHAVLVARHVADPSRHAAILDTLSRAGVRSEAQAKLMLADLVDGPGSRAVHDARMGLHAETPEQLGTRTAMLDAGLKGLAKHPAIRAIAERDAAKLELDLPDGQRGAKKLRTDLAKRINDVVAELARTDSHVAQLLSEAAQARERGVSKKLAAQAFADGVAAVLEKDGIAGLAKAADRPAEMRGFSNPHGPEAQAQVKALEERAKFSLPDHTDAAGDAAHGRADDAQLPDDPARRGAAGGRAASRGQSRAAGRGASGENFLASLGERDAVRNFDAGRGFRGTVTVEHIGNARDLNVYLHDAKAKLPKLGQDPVKAIDTLDRLNNFAATVTLHEVRPGQFEVQYLKVDLARRRQGIATRAYDAIERELGIAIMPSGRLSEDGIAFWRKRAPELVADHRWDAPDNLNKSPRQLLAERADYQRAAESNAHLPNVQASLLRQVRRMDDLLATIPAEAKLPERLKQRFSLRDPSDLTPRGAEAWPKISAGVEAVIARLPREVRVEMRRRVIAGGRDVDGYYDPYHALVRIALNDGAERVLRHEEIHVLRDLKLMSDAEFEVIARRGLDDGAMHKFNIEQRYTDAYAKRFEGDRYALQAAMVEEMVAEMWGASKKGVLYGKAVDSVFGRLTKFFAELRERLGNAKDGLGFQAASDVFRRIETGAMAQRPRLPETQLAIPIRTKRMSLPDVPAPRRPSRSDKSGATLPLPDHVRDLVGLKGGSLAVDLAYIARKRNAKDVDPTTRMKAAGDMNKVSPAEVAEFIQRVLEKPDYARLYKDGDAWNFVRKFEDGRAGLVSVKTNTDTAGRHFVTTAYMQNAGSVADQLAGTLKQHGADGVKWYGDPEALRADLASVSQRSAAGQGPRDVPGSTIADVRQRIAAGSPDALSPGQALRAEGTRVEGFATLAELCKR